MPLIYPLGHPQFTFDAALDQFVEVPGVEMPGATLGELLVELQRRTGARVVPDPEAPKYFRYHQYPNSEDFELVDIHITRGRQQICPKQDLGFALLPSDKVIPGLPVC